MGSFSDFSQTLFSNTIRLIVFILTVYLLIQCGRWFVLPSLRFDEHFPPWGVPLWRGFMYIFSMVFHWIVVTLICIYIVWWIIKTYVPEWILFFPVRSMILAIPPFPPLTDAGILPLIDNCRNILTGGGSIGNKIYRLIQAVASFLVQGTQWVRGFLPVGTQSQVNNAGKSSGLDTYQQPSVQTIDPTPIDPSKQPTAEQIAQINREYAQCVEENTAHISEDANVFDKIALKLKNSNVGVKCNLNKFSTMTNILSTKV